MEKTKKTFNVDKLRDFLLNYALYIILFGIILGYAIYDSDFRQVTVFTDIIKQASTRGIMALGVAGMIVLTGTDLSAGRILGLSAAVTASLVQASDYVNRMYPDLPELNLLIPLLASILIAVIFSCINGFGVAYLKMHAFIISLGTQLIAYGALTIYISSQKLGAQPLSTFTKGFNQITTGKLNIFGFELPYLAIYFIIAAIVVWFIWEKTEFGKNMFAVGGNMEAASVSGVNVGKTIMLVYILGGILYGIAGYLEAGRLANVDTNTGVNYELDAISACVIGGVSFNGGVGTVPGIVIGILILQSVNYVLYFAQVNQYLQYVIKGLIIIIAVAIDVRKYIEKK